MPSNKNNQESGKYLIYTGLATLYMIIIFSILDEIRQGEIPFIKIVGSIFAFSLILFGIYESFYRYKEKKE